MKTTPTNDDSGQTKILTILDDSKEVARGRYNELNLLREMGVMTTVKRSSAAGKWVTQTHGSIERKTVA